MQFTGESPFSVSEVSGLAHVRAACRRSALLADASIVQVDPVPVAGLPGLVVITKTRVGMAASYVGRLIAPLAGPHVVVSMEAIEHGTTGIRDALATAALAESGELRIESSDTPGEPGRVKGWRQDPYDASLDRDTLTFASDDERLDVLFPQHPLSKIRATLAAIRGTATITLPVHADGLPSLENHDPPSRRPRMPSGPLANLLIQTGHFEQAALTLEEAVAEAAADGRGETPELARHVLFLGLAYDFQGKHRESLSRFQRVEHIATTTMGPEHLMVAQAVCNQRRALMSIRDHEAAEPLFERALALFESTDGDGSNTAIALNGLGMVRNAQQRYQEAIPLLERALRNFEAAHGPKFKDCGAVWGHLAIALAHTGETQRANDALTRARAILKP